MASTSRPFSTLEAGFGTVPAMIRPCPVCRTPHPEPSPFSRKPWLLKECRGTGLAYMENPPAYAALETEFAFEVMMVRERERRREAEPVWSRLSDFMKVLRRRLLPRRNKFQRLAFEAWDNVGQPAEFRVLDVGCGFGNMLDAMAGAFAERGVRMVPFGVEISRELHRISSERFAPLGGQVINAPATEGIRRFAAEKFHCALLSSYLEHEVAPGEVLAALRERLVPGGRVLIKVPNFASWNRHFRGARWCGFRFPDHVNYFTPVALRRQVEQAGLDVARMNWSDVFPLSDNMYLVAACPASEVNR
jgi:SAM-dependent methyltransferase